MSNVESDDKQHEHTHTHRRQLPRTPKSASIIVPITVGLRSETLFVNSGNNNDLEWLCVCVCVFVCRRSVLFSAAGAQRVAKILHMKRLWPGESAHDAIPQTTRTLTIELCHKPQTVSDIQQWQLRPALI